MKKVILKFTGLAVLAAIMVYNVQVFSTEINSDITLTTLKNIAIAQGEGGENCQSGNPGSNSCSAEIEVMGIGQKCSVGCDPGYYACCNTVPLTCVCIEL